QVTTLGIGFRLIVEEPEASEVIGHGELVDRKRSQERLLKGQEPRQRHDSSALALLMKASRIRRRPSLVNLDDLGFLDLRRGHAAELEELGSDPVEAGNDKHACDHFAQHTDRGQGVLVSTHKITRCKARLWSSSGAKYVTCAREAYSSKQP